MWLSTVALAAVPSYPDCPFGVNAHQAEDAALDQAAAAGVGWVRFDFNWLQFEPAQDQFDWTVPDRFVDHADALGLQVYATIGYTPAWAAGSACDDASPNQDDHCLTRLPANQADWEDFVRQSVDRYGDRVKAWGIWNEPNLSQFFAGTRDDYVNAILIPAADVVHAECADCLVVGPELASLREAHWDADEGVCVFGECTFNGWDDSLQHVLQDAGGYLDVVSHHKYSDPADGWWDSAIAGDYLLGVQYMHGIGELTSTYAPGKPVWITEFGWETAPSGSYDETYAADQLTTLYTALPDVQAGTWGSSPAWPEVVKLFWYDLSDDPSGPSWGLLHSDLTAKPAYDAYAAAIASMGGCAAFVPGTTTTTTGPTDTPTSTTTTTTPTDPSTPSTETTPTTATTPTGTTPADTVPLDPPDKGCGCASSGTAGWPAWLLVLVARRRGGRR
jgi:hypothetical protein